eukprot:3517491-Amphidinium_carterae.1
MSERQGGVWKGEVCQPLIGVSLAYVKAGVAALTRDTSAQWFLSPNNFVNNPTSRFQGQPCRNQIHKSESESTACLAAVQMRRETQAAMQVSTFSVTTSTLGQSSNPDMCIPLWKAILALD